MSSCLTANSLAAGSEAAMAVLSFPSLTGCMAGAVTVTSPLSEVMVGLVVPSSSGCHAQILPEDSSALVSPSPPSNPCSAETVLNSDDSIFEAYLY